MSDLTNTPKREPAYGKAAERYSKEQRLGARVLEILAREWAPGERDASARDYVTIRQAARSLGLLPESPKAEEIEPCLVCGTTIDVHEGRCAAHGKAVRP